MDDRKSLDSSSKGDRWAEAIRRGAEATRCRGFLLSLLELRRKTLVDELEGYETEPTSAAAVAARLQELRHIEAMVDNMIRTAQYAEEEMSRE